MTNEEFLAFDAKPEIISAHEAAEREAYFLEEMTKRVEYADSPDAVWIPHAEFLNRWQIKKAAFLARPRS
jgi:hypothetical protein